MARKSLNDKPAIDIFESIFGKGILDRQGIRLISAGEVNLAPRLLKK